MKLEVFSSSLSIAAMIAGVLLLWQAWKSRRSADDVALVLVEQSGRARSGFEDTISAAKPKSRDRVIDITRVLFGVSEEIYGRKRIQLWSTAALALVATWVLGRGLSVAGLIMATVLICAIGVLCQGAIKRRAHTAALREIDFYLPIVMERIVMAVEAGLDILPAMTRIIEIAQAEASSDDKTTCLDPVSRLLCLAVSLVEAGLSFDEALTEVAQAVPSPAFKHAFVHLAVAHREGGELILPLRELSDATQLYFQESVEEEIAKMPVRATLPLLCTFAGLILFFVTAPLMQVLGLMSTAMPK